MWPFYWLFRNFPEFLETFQTVLKQSRPSETLPDCRKLFRLSQNLPDCLKTFQIIGAIWRYAQKLSGSQKLSGGQCWHADRALMSLIEAAIHAKVTVSSRFSRIWLTETSLFAKWPKRSLRWQVSPFASKQFDDDWMVFSFLCGLKSLLLSILRETLPGQGSSLRWAFQEF